MGVFGFGDELRGVCGVKFHQEFLAVPLDGFRTQAHLVRNLRTGEAVCHQLENLLLAVREDGAFRLRGDFF